MLFSLLIKSWRILNSVLSALPLASFLLYGALPLAQAPPSAARVREMAVIGRRAGDLPAAGQVASIPGRSWLGEQELSGSAVVGTSDGVTATAARKLSSWRPCRPPAQSHGRRPRAAGTSANFEVARPDLQSTNVTTSS